MRTYFVCMLSAIVSISIGCQSKSNGNADSATPKVAPPVAQSMQFDDRDLDKDLSYEFQEWGCSTGIKNFQNRGEYCETLKDDSLNNSCADLQRAMAYKFKCETPPIMRQNVDGLGSNRISTCRVYGEDSSEGVRFLKNASAQKNFNWSGGGDLTFQMLGGFLKRFGISYVTLQPLKDSGATNMLTLGQQFPGGDSQTTASTGGEGWLSLMTQDFDLHKGFTGECQVKSVGGGKVARASDIMKCRWRITTKGLAEKTQSQLIGLRSQSVSENTLWTGPQGETVKIRVTPSLNSLHLSVEKFDGRKKFEVRAKAQSGLEFHHRDVSAGSDIWLNCAPASQ